MFFSCKLCHLALLSDTKHKSAAIFLSGKGATVGEWPQERKHNDK
jgi:hypothetical protein